jgi:anti-anti-sigma regulatory factor
VRGLKYPGAIASEFKSEFKNKIARAGKEERVSITLDQSESLSVIRLEGVVDISSAAELKETLLKALEMAQETAQLEAARLESSQLESSQLESSQLDASQPEALPQAAAAGVRIELSAAEVLDVTAYELLWAAEREARRTGLPFSFAGPAPDVLLTALAEAGLEEFPILEESPVVVQAG